MLLLDGAMLAPTVRIWKPSRRWRSLIINVSDGQAVSGILLVIERPKACVVLAYGAGAGMAHPFVTAVVMGMQDRGLATLRYQFTHMEKGSRRQDRSAVCEATRRQALRLHPVIRFRSMKSNRRR